MNKKHEQENLLDEIIKISYEAMLNESKIHKITSEITDELRREASIPGHYKRVFKIVPTIENPKEDNVYYIVCPPNIKDVVKDGLIKYILSYYNDQKFIAEYDTSSSKLTISWEGEYNSFVECKENNDNPSPNKKQRKPQNSYDYIHTNKFPQLYNKYKRGKISAADAAEKLDIGVSTFNAWCREHDKQLESENKQEV